VLCDVRPKLIDTREGGWGLEIFITSKPGSHRMPDSWGVSAPKEHVLRIFSTTLHNWQSGSWGHPLVARRSVVQSMFWVASHEKFLHFGEAHASQMMLWLAEAIEPINCV
jgi:hypothetical protein